MTKYFSLVVLGLLVMLFTTTNVFAAWEGIVFDEVGVLTEDEYDQVSFIADKLAYSGISVKIVITNQDNKNFELKDNFLVVIVYPNKSSLEIYYGGQLKEILDPEKNSILDLLSQMFEKHNYAEALEISLNKIRKLLNDNQQKIENDEKTKKSIFIFSEEGFDIIMNICIDLIFLLLIYFFVTLKIRKK